MNKILNNTENTENNIVVAWARWAQSSARLLAVSALFWIGVFAGEDEWLRVLGVGTSSSGGASRTRELPIAHIKCAAGMVWWLLFSVVQLC